MCPFSFHIAPITLVNIFMHNLHWDTFQLFAQNDLFLTVPLPSPNSITMLNFVQKTKLVGQGGDLHCGIS